jgi:hypothetical protein
MRMVQPENEPDAASFELSQFIGQETEPDSLRLIEIEPPATAAIGPPDLDAEALGVTRTPHHTVD